MNLSISIELSGNHFYEGSFGLLFLDALIVVFFLLLLCACVCVCFLVSFSWSSSDPSIWSNFFHWEIGVS